MEGPWKHGTYAWPGCRCRWGHQCLGKILVVVTRGLGFATRSWSFTPIAVIWHEVPLFSFIDEEAVASGETGVRARPRVGFRHSKLDSGPTNSCEGESTSDGFARRAKCHTCSNNEVLTVICLLNTQDVIAKLGAVSCLGEVADRHVESHRMTRSDITDAVGTRVSFVDEGEELKWKGFMRKMAGSAGAGVAPKAKFTRAILHGTSAQLQQIHDGCSLRDNEGIQEVVGREKGQFRSAKATTQDDVTPSRTLHRVSWVGNWVG